MYRVFFTHQKSAAFCTLHRRRRLSNALELHIQCALRQITIEIQCHLAWFFYSRKANLIVAVMSVSVTNVFLCNLTVLGSDPRRRHAQLFMRFCACLSQFGLVLIRTVQIPCQQIRFGWKAIIAEVESWVISKLNGSVLRLLSSRNVALLKTTVDRPKKKKQTHNLCFGLTYSRWANLIVAVMLL